MRVSKSKNKYKKKNRALPIFFALIGITAAAFAVAIVWQGFEEIPFVVSEHENRVSSQENAVTQSSSSSQVNMQASSQAYSSAPSSVPDEVASLPDKPLPPESPGFNPPREAYDYALPASEAVPLSYFDDAIFIGDSITTGIMSYKLMSNTTVVAFTGIHTVNALTKECIDTGDGRKTLLDAARDYGDKKKVYIMLGGNGLGYDLKIFIEGYADFLDSVISQYPDALIYVQTMMPVTDFAHNTYPLVNNEIINEYNLAIQELAREKKVLLIDTANALIDENGMLPAEASPVDGMHFGPEYYLKWFDYIRTHTAPETR